ncbi:uncharacterized protein [Ptychodera flava]|uniref:uncharacterized protein n=1 Tax=Ptychodera flava TaxID=63121 RepID=UPI003969FB1B
MSNSTTPIDVRMIDTLEDISYGLYFHSRAHFFSADYHEQLDSLLTYIYSFCTAVGTACGGAGVLIPIIRNESRKYTLMQVCFAFVMLIFILGSTTIKELQGTQHSPAKKTRLHYEAALEMRQLSNKANLWIMKRHFENVTNKMMIEKYEEIVAGRSNIAKKIMSEDWTFPCVHATLPTRIIEKKKRLKRDIKENINPCWSSTWQILFSTLYLLFFGFLLAIVVPFLVYLSIKVAIYLFQKLAADLDSSAKLVDSKANGTQSADLQEDKAVTEKVQSEADPSSVITGTTTVTEEKRQGKSTTADDIDKSRKTRGRKAKL